jgi:flagellin
MQVYDENMSAAKSRISDVDMASETAELTKTNILSQAGVSVLSQANQNNQLALKLIG